MVGENQENGHLDFQQNFVETTQGILNVSVANCLFLDKQELTT